MLAVLAALLMLHRRIIRPLAELAAMVIRLAHGRPLGAPGVRQGSREIAELASAIEVLRIATIEADAAAVRRRAESQRWTAQLRQVLDTIDLMQARAVTITDVLPALAEHLAALALDDATSVPGLAAATAATRAGIRCCEPPLAGWTRRCGTCIRWATATISASMSRRPRWTRWSHVVTAIQEWSTACRRSH